MVKAVAKVLDLRTVMLRKLYFNGNGIIRCYAEPPLWSYLTRDRLNRQR
jgi:hypothetical protein